jgi:hypothetical protein
LKTGFARVNVSIDKHQPVCYTFALLPESDYKPLGGKIWLIKPQRSNF